MSADRDRSAWLRERRGAVEAEYDAEAAGYDDHPYPATSHPSFVQRLLETCPAGGTVLDAPCRHLLCTGRLATRRSPASRRRAGS